MSIDRHVLAIERQLWGSIVVGIDCTFMGIDRRVDRVSTYGGSIALATVSFDPTSDLLSFNRFI